MISKHCSSCSILNQIQEQVKTLLIKHGLVVTRVSGNASMMGAIEGRIKLAICLRVLFGMLCCGCFIFRAHVVWNSGESFKTLAQLFHVSLKSAVDAFNIFMDLLCNCKMLEFGQPPTAEELQLRALEFSRRSSQPRIFQHCVEAIDGLLIRIQCPKKELDQRNYFSGHKLDYGLNLQASCDANCRFVNASLCCPGIYLSVVCDVSLKYT